MKTVIVFKDKAMADAICNEIACTPDIENGIGPVWLWFNPENVEQTDNTIKYNIDATGRCAMCHNWAEIDRDWLLAYLDEWIQLGQVQILNKLPDDWQYAVENY